MNSISQLSAYFAAFFALLLFIFVMAFLLSSKLREDLKAQGNESSLWGYSAKGTAMIVVMFMLTTATVVLALDASSPTSSREFNQAMDFKARVEGVLRSMDTEIKTPEDLKLSFDTISSALSASREDVKRLKLQVEEVTAKSEIFKNKQDQAVQQDLIESLKAVDPLDHVASQIRVIAAENKGPWREFSLPKKILVSVAGEIQGEALRGCNYYHHKTVQLISLYKHGADNAIDSDSVIITVGENTGKVAFSDTCREVKPYDLQVSCELAHRLLSSDVLSCDEKHNPLWRQKLKGSRLVEFIVMVRRADSFQLSKF